MHTPHAEDRPMGRVSKRARLLQSLFGALRALHPASAGMTGKLGGNRISLC